MKLELGPRFRWDYRPSCNAAGIYAYFIDSPDQLRPISVPTNGLLYVGMTGTSLDARCHFDHQNSGFSTFRRSLGAILKGQLQLRAMPRAPGPSRTNLLCYRFDADGESRLTEWMRESLTYSYVEIGNDDVAMAEKDQIACMCPPLNLNGWTNDQRAEIKRLRAACVSEASHTARG
jgi:hypothetical protein